MTSWLAVLVAWLGTLAGPGDTDPECVALAALDARRAVAFVLDEPTLLDDVYVDEDLASADREVLADYRERGLRLRGMVQHRLSCAVADRGDDTVVLEVVDRLGDTRVTGPRGTRALPRDSASRRTVTLVSVATGWTERAWRVAASR